MSSQHLDWLSPNASNFNCLWSQYWYGILNERRECLAMCIWENREAAIKAIHKPAHTLAMKLTSVMYETYTLERYSLKIDTDLTPTFTPLSSMRG